jgi:hypothetical protein
MGKIRYIPVVFLCLGVGVVTRDLFISAFSSAIRVAALLLLTTYVYFVNIRDYGVRSLLMI